MLLVVVLATCVATGTASVGRAETPAAKTVCASLPTVQIDAQLHTYAGGYGGFIYSVTWGGGYSTGSSDPTTPSITVTDENGTVLSSGEQVLGEASLPSGVHTLTAHLNDPCGTAASSSSVTVPAKDWAVKFEKLPGSSARRGKITKITYEVFPISDVWHAQGPTSIRFSFGGSGLRINRVHEIQPETHLTCRYSAGVANCTAQRAAAAPCPSTFVSCLVSTHGVIELTPTRTGAIRITAEITAPSGDTEPANDRATATFSAR
jgi:hypothetical protein